MSIVPRRFPAKVVRRTWAWNGKEIIKIHVGDVVKLRTSKKLHLVTSVSDWMGAPIRVKVLGIGRTRHKTINGWEITSIDTFMTAAYKANAPAG